MSCIDCETAKGQEWHGFNGNCSGCRLRAVARGSHYDRVRRTQALDKRYLLYLEGFGLKHEDVKAAAAADYMQMDKR